MQPEKALLNKEIYSLFQQEPILMMLIQLGQVDVDSLCYWDLEQLDHECMSRGFWKLLGYQCVGEDQQPQLLDEITHRDDWCRARTLFQGRCSNTSPTQLFDQVVRYRHHDGSTVWVRWQGVVSRDLQGKPVWIVAAFSDVTAIKASARLLSGQNFHLREAANDIVSICSNCKKIRDHAGKWRQMEHFVADHPDASVSHGICPECRGQLYPGLSNRH